MILNIETSLDYALQGRCDILLQIEAADGHGQSFRDPVITTGPVDSFRRIEGEDNLGDRIWIAASDRFSCNYSARVEITRDAPDIASLRRTPLHDLPSVAVSHLMDSRYCPAQEFQAYVASEFKGLAGGAMIAAMRDWMSAKIAYVPGSSSPQTTARDTFVQRQGICRDFAHVMVTFARAAGIPARFASVYAPRVTPPDFHAVAEVWLGGGWQLVDATGMAEADEIAVIGVGRDAADAAFMTIYGAATLTWQQVKVSSEG